MEPTSAWEMMLIGVLALLVVLWLRPGIGAALERSRTAEKEWAGALIPIALAALFVIFLIIITRP